MMKKIGVIPPCGMTFAQFFDKDYCFFTPGLMDSQFYELKMIMQRNGYELVEYIKGINVECIVDFESTFTEVFRKHKSKFVYCAFEPPIVQPLHNDKYIKQLSKIVDYIITNYERQADNKRVLFAPNPTALNLKTDSFGATESKKLLTNISGNKISRHRGELYSKRLEVIRYFENHHAEDFDFYGQGWQICGYKNYKGTIDCKFATLQKYKFSICFENFIGDGVLITEKIFDCLLSRCVPIYMGANNITDYIPQSCFIDYRQFASLEECYCFIKNMSDEQYSGYITAIESWLASDAKNVFVPEHLANQLINVISMPKQNTNNIFVWCYLYCTQFFTRVCNVLYRVYRRIFPN